MKTKLLVAMAALVVAGCGPDWIIPEPTPNDGGVIVAVGGGDDAGTDAGTHDAGSPGGPDGGTGPDGGVPGQSDGGTTDGGSKCKNGYGWGDKNHCHKKRWCPGHNLWENGE